MSEAGWLSEWLAECEPDAAARATVRFPDVDWAVTDWAFAVGDSLTEPEILVDVYGAGFGYPDVVRRLKGLVDDAARNNLID